MQAIAVTNAQFQSFQIRTFAYYSHPVSQSCFSNVDIAQLFFSVNQVTDLG